MARPAKPPLLARLIGVAPFINQQTGEGDGSFVVIVDVAQGVGRLRLGGDDLHALAAQIISDVPRPAPDDAPPE